MRRTIYKASTSTDLSGMVAMMSGGVGGAAYGGGNAQFGPGTPPFPRPIGGDPRMAQGRPGWNLPTLPGEGKFIDFKTLRAVAKIDPFIRKGIEVRKDQMANLNWEVIARDRKNPKKARQTVVEQQDNIAKVKTWMEKPDGAQPWSSWLTGIIEDHLTIDAIALYKRRSLDPDAGPVSSVTGTPMGGLMWLEQLDGATIKPLRDTGWRTPRPPLDAYQQFLFGSPVWGFTTDELIYAVKSDTVESPYGFSPVEMFLTLINLNLRYWSSMNAIYTDGTLPEGIVTAPEGWTPQQIQGFADNWNKALAGDPRALRKLHMAPHGVGWIAFKEHVFDKELARFLVDILALAMDLTPMELGFAPDNQGLGGKGFSENQDRIQNRRSVGPTVRFLCDNILNPILWEEFGLRDLEFAVVDKDEQDEESRSKADDIDLRNGRVSLDELIERDGGDPIGVGRMFVLGPGIVLGEPDLVKLSEDGAAALGLITPVAIGADGLPVPPEPEPAIGPDGKPLVDPETGQPLQHPTLGPDGTPLKLPMKPGTGGPAPQPEAAPPAQKPKPSFGKIADVDNMLDDLRRWELKSMRALRRNKSAAVKFISDYIDGDLAERISGRLAKAATPDQIREAFVDPTLLEAVKNTLREAA